MNSKQLRDKIIDVLIEKRPETTEEERNKVADTIISMPFITEETIPIFLKSAGITD